MRFSSVSLLVAATQATLHLGGCPNLSIENFDAAKFAGKWYEVQRETFIPFEIGWTCTTQEFHLNDEGSLDYNWRAWSPMNWMRGIEYGSVQGQLYNCESGSPDTYSCQGNMYRDDSDDVELTYDVIATDNFENWYVMYNCMEMIKDGFRGELVHIQARTPQISAEHLAEAHAAIKAKLPNYDLSWMTVSDTDQSKCEHEWLW